MTVEPILLFVASLSNFQASDLKALEEGRTLEQMNPPMGSKFTFKVEEGAVIKCGAMAAGGTAMSASRIRFS